MGIVPKLILDLNNKEKYVIHHKLVKYYESLGMKATKVHRTISFKESRWLKQYIDFNTNQRTQILKKDLWKLMNNAFYGKTLENNRGRTDLEFVTDSEKAVKLFAKPTFKDIMFNENFLAIKIFHSVQFNRPIYTGMCVLGYSKLLMYQLYYDKLGKEFSDIEVIASDTDSLFLSIRTDDVCRDLERSKDDLDTSDYLRDHSLFSEKNQKIIGKFKDEVNGKIITEITYLKSKVYTYESQDRNEQKKLKGILKTTIRKHNIKRS